MLKTNQIQSLLAVNRARINTLHQAKVAAKSDAKMVKLLNNMFNKVADVEAQAALKQIYKAMDYIDSNIARSVEVQKALKNTLKVAYDVENGKYVTVVVDGVRFVPA